MNNLIKKLLIGTMTGLMVACSSESGEVIVPGDEETVTGTWRQIKFATTVESGTTGNITTRRVGELDEATDLPRAYYPRQLGIYLHKYSSTGSGTLDNTVLTICKEDEQDNTTGLFSFSVSEDKTQVILKGVDEDEGKTLSFPIGEVGAGQPPSDLFFFTSKSEPQNMECPVLDENPYPNTYPGARGEFGDDLFATDGYFFVWKDETKTVLSLYYIMQNDYVWNFVTDIPMDGTTAQQPSTLNMRMKRMTSCLSLRLIIVDSFNSNGTINNIKDMAQGISFDDAVDLTNDALKKHIEDAGDLELAETVDVRNIFVHGKVLDNFPIRYNWINGLVTDLRQPVVVCHLAYPAWVNQVTSYPHGSSYLTGLTSQCDSEPFVPADTKKIPSVSFDLFVGVGQRDTTILDEEGGGTYRYAVKLRVPFEGNDGRGNAYQVFPNTRTYMYVALTLDNVFTLYRKIADAETNAEPASTRSLETIEEITIPAEQVFMTSEPL